MAVGAEQLPIAAIGRIVVVVVVAMMDLEQLQVGVSELARTTTAYPRINLERLLAVAFGSRFACTPSLGDDAVESSVIGTSLWRSHEGAPMCGCSNNHCAMVASCL